MDGSDRSGGPATTSAYVKALHDLVLVNSLFTVAVFLSFFLVTPGQQSLVNPSVCDAGIDMTKKLLVFQVVSFSFFLFSSLVAQGLKFAINLLNSKYVKVLRFWMMGPALGSFMGFLFLMVSMVYVIQIRLGVLSCGSIPAVYAVSTLTFSVSCALMFYISVAVYSFVHY